MPPPAAPVLVRGAGAVPAHTVWLAIAFTDGVGFTVIVKLTDAPVQADPDDGVTVMVAVIGVAVVFVAINPGILPVPEAPSPIAVLLFVQLYTMVPPVVGLVKFTGAVISPLHTIWLGTGSTVANGFTSTVAVVVGPVHVVPPLV